MNAVAAETIRRESVRILMKLTNRAQRNFNQEIIWDDIPAITFWVERLCIRSNGINFMCPQHAHQHISYYSVFYRSARKFSTTCHLRGKYVRFFCSSKFVCVFSKLAFSSAPDQQSRRATHTPRNTHALCCPDLYVQENCAPVVHANKPLGSQTGSCT